MPTPLTPVTSLTRRDAVLSALRNAILTGRLRPGDRLREVHLAKDLGVSRPTLREAIYQLIHEGLLVQEDYKGVRVASIDPETITDIAVVRVALETLAAKAIASDPTGASQEALRDAWQAYEEAAASGDLAREADAHLAFHRAIWTGSGNAMLARIWPIVSASINLALSADTAAREHDDRSRRLHRALVDAILSNDNGRIESAVREHIQGSAAELLGLLGKKKRRRSTAQA